MSGGEFSLILLPTLGCNAACDYCFVDRRAEALSTEGLALLARRIGEFVREAELAALTLHWQGGEVMTLSPDWFRQARDLIAAETAGTGVYVHHSLQSNMMAYDGEWGRLIREMFGGSVGTSLDYPNRYRRLEGGGPGEYNDLWAERIRQAWADGIQTGVICLPNRDTLDIGAEAFYHHVVEELGIGDFQLNTPFSGGSLNTAKGDYPLDPPRLGAFLVDLARVWLERDREGVVRLGPFAEFLDRFENEQATLPCLFHRNCADGFLCVDPFGNVSQCDCWVASYPEYRFGNIFRGDSLAGIVRDNPVRERFVRRPAALLQREDCPDCPYLALCHGGCPVRAFTCAGDVLAKDPYCEAYLAMFRFLEKVACGENIT